jgi:hypothetical protein
MSYFINSKIVEYYISLLNKKEMKNKNEENRLFPKSTKEQDNEEKPSSTQKDLKDDPLQVVREDEEDLKEEKDTEDDIFDDDELNLDPSLDKDEW